jgi:L-aminopeptidase/D-esterase-like protein
VSEIAVAGVRAGHWTGTGTGVTVVLLPTGTIGSAEVRGGAPATREMTLLEPPRVVTQVDAIVFTGGSAFGLAAADGVMRYLLEHERGYPTAGGLVPIVPTAAIYDLLESGPQRPGPDEGYAAARAAAESSDALVCGCVGVGAGATIGKWRGREHATRGGFGVAHTSVEDATVAALAVVNAVGDVIAEDGSVLAGSTAPFDSVAFPTTRPFEEGNTTLVAVVTDGRVDKLECHLLAQSAHDGLARSLRPAHTRFDGDATIALSTATTEVHLDRLRAATVDVVAAAIRAAVAPNRPVAPG